MSLKKCIILFAAAFVTSVALAQQSSTSPSQLFYKELKTFEPIFQTSGDPAKIVEALEAKEISRVSAFNLQALGRVFSMYSDDFKSIKKDFKDIEDGLGKIDYWKKVGNMDELKKIRKKFAEKLQANGWISLSKKVKSGSPKLVEYRSFLDTFKWPSSEKVISALAGREADFVEEIHKTDFDFSVLEEGNGLHEYRRQLRWYTIESRVAGGMFQFRQPQTSCPVPELLGLLKDHIANSKYSDLPVVVAQKKPCQISRCLFLSVVKMVEDIGELKDEAEGIVGGTDDDNVPPEIRKKAEAIYKSFNNTQTLPKLITELRQCQ